MLAGKRILLVISGGIAAYKCLELIRRLRENGAAVRCILSKAGAEFVTPLSVAALSEDKVYGELFSLTDEAEMGHIQLSRDADLLVVAPASADLLGKMASGRADDLASTALLATDKPVLVAPAMNVRMWEHPATKANMALLVERGVMTVGPNEGDMACGEYGFGRMAEAAEILAAIEAYFGAAAPLSGRRALVTSGPTVEAIGVQVVAVESAEEMLAACQAALPVEVAVCAAAVSDWRVKRASGQKLKKNGGAPPKIELAVNPDILASLSAAGNRRPSLVVGFAAETEKVVQHAKAKLKAKGCDWILANDVSPGTGTFGGAENLIHLIDGSGVEDWPRMAKQEVAERLALRIAAALDATSGSGGA
jgi:phosphopantothenoylcysteine decarboxylase/phosphopantothenate--cysteine ligase